MSRSWKFAQVEIPPRGKTLLLTAYPRKDVVTIWTVGRITSLFMDAYQDKFPASVSIGLDPLDTRTTDACTALLHDFSSPKGFHPKADSQMTVRDAFRASCWQNIKLPGESDSSVRNTVYASFVSDTYRVTAEGVH